MSSKFQAQFYFNTFEGWEGLKLAFEAHTALGKPILGLYGYPVI